MQSLIKAPKLNPGDRVAAVTLSWGGPGAYPHRYKIGKKQCEAELDIRLVETKHALKDPDWLDQNPSARADDLMEAFSDPSIKGIFSTIGGDDSIRILPFLDLSIIYDNPKVFMGYSDSTITHLVCLKAGLATLYGPSIMASFGENGGIFPYLAESVKQALFSSNAVGEILPNPAGWTAEFLGWSDPNNQNKRRKLNPSNGWHFLQGNTVAEGPLIGGCLESLEFQKGTEWFPPLTAWENAILFIETSEEAPAPIFVKRCLRNYAAQGILERLNGIIMGRPGGNVLPSNFLHYEQALIQVVRDECGLDELAVVANMDFGHTDPFFVLPYGVKAQIDPINKSFSILESAVR